MSPSGKLHCELIETFSRSLCHVDHCRPISLRRGHCGIITRLNTIRLLVKAGIRNLMPAILYQPCILPANWQSRNFQLYLSLIIFSKLSDVQPKFSLLTVLKYVPFYLMLCITYPNFFERKILT